jgi:hypothetical protein
MELTRLKDFRRQVGHLAETTMFVDAMRAAGDPPEAVERQLLGLGISPAAAMAAASWLSAA